MWFFLNLYLPQVLNLGTFASSAALLSMTVLIMIGMVGLAPRAIGRFGPKAMTVTGLALLALGVTGLALVRPDGSFVVDVLPASLLAALGMSLAFIPSLGTAISSACRLNPWFWVLALWRRVAMTWYGHRLIIFGFLPQISKTVGVGVSVQQSRALGEQARSARLDDLAVFRCVFYGCLTLRADALFELTDAVLCADGPVTTLVGLTLAAEHRRGHGGLYDGLGSGRIEVDRLRRSLVNLPVPRDGQGRITLAVDVSPWLRPDAATCPDRSFCHVYGRGKGQLRIEDVAVDGAQSYASWADQLISADRCAQLLPKFCAEVGLPADTKGFRLALEVKLAAQCAATDAGYPDTPTR